VQIVRALRDAAPDAQVVIKVHPKESETEVAWIREIPPRVMVVGDEVPVLDLIAATAVNVGAFSTTLVLSAALDRPTVSVALWPGLDYWRRVTEWSGVDRVETASALTESVRRHLGDPQYQALWQARREAFTRDEFVMDCRGTDRVADLVERLVRERGPSR
jgi:hypothetical protein